MASNSQTQSLNDYFGSGIILTKTVGTDPTLCATTDAITVTLGTQVYYCYEITNYTASTLDYHTVEDSDLGIVLNQFPTALTPGASIFVT